MLSLTLRKGLEDAGAKVSDSTASGNRAPDLLLDVSLAGSRARFAVELRRRAPYPAEVEGLGGIKQHLAQWGIPLLQAPAISERQGAELVRGGWSWADEQGNYDIRAPRFVLRNAVASRHRSRRPSRPFPHGNLGLAIVRALIHRQGDADGVTVKRLADSADASSARTSQVLSQLSDTSLVRKKAHGLWAVDRSKLLELFLDEYEGPRGRRQPFYALDVSAAARAIAESTSHDAAFSGDVAADVLTPHRRPSHLVVYLRRGRVGEGPGLVATESEAEANVIVVHPLDRSVFLPGPVDPRILGADGKLAHPTQIAWDLRQLGGADRLQQLEMLKAWILRTP